MGRIYNKREVNVPWVVQIDKHTHKERDDWWYLHCKEINHPIPSVAGDVLITQKINGQGSFNRAQRIGKYYNIRDANSLILDRNMKISEVAKLYELDEDLVQKHIDEFRELAKDMSEKQALKVWRQNYIYELHKDGMMAERIKQLLGCAHITFRQAIQRGEELEKEAKNVRKHTKFQ